MLIAIRHGATSANEGGQKTARGYLPEPLTLEGMEEAQAAADLIARHVERGEVKHIWTDSLVRTVQSATYVGCALDMPIEIDDNLRTLDIGNMTGKPVNKEHSDKLKHYIKHPNQRIPGGESYGDFLKRVEPLLRKMVESKDTLILVTHGRNLSLLKAIVENGGGKPNIDVLLSPVPVDPGGLMIVGSDFKLYYESPLAEPSKDMS